MAPIAQNRPAPNFNLPNLFGAGTVSLHDLRGDVVVVNFWASWCAACQREAPALSDLYQHYQSTGVEFVGIDHGDVSSKAQAFARHNEMGYPIVADSGDLLAKFGGIGLPSTFVIDRTGQIRFQLIGAIDPAALRRCVEELRTT